LLRPDLRPAAPGDRGAGEVCVGAVERKNLGEGREKMSLIAGLVVTTISEPLVLESYFENFRFYDHLDDVRVFVIPDRRTPSAAYEYCENINRRGLRIYCPTIEEQEKFLSKIGLSPLYIPYDSDNRRNIGYLMAIEAGVDFVISIDDDNFCLKETDFWAEHAVVCQENLLVEEVNAEHGWFNVCSLLEFDTPVMPYPRGFPYFARHVSSRVERAVKRSSIHINAGLWLGDPDLDGISWLVAPACAISFTGPSISLGPNTWSPINTQNTALRREAISAFYFVKMGYPLAGLGYIDRYGDIFSGYFVQICAHHLGGAVRFGSPVVQHCRNKHNYLKDATQEWACILVLEDLLPDLTRVKLEGTTYPELYMALSYALEDIVEQKSGTIWTDATRGYFHQMAYYMRQWTKVASKFL
ncbi:MAG: hypothetical protein ACP5N6_15835, partial [Anaerolineae bacterium]